MCLAGNVNNDSDNYNDKSKIDNSNSRSDNISKNDKSSNYDNLNHYFHHKTARIIVTTRKALSKL